MEYQISFTHLLLLGAAAGFTIFLGLPVAILTVRPRMRAMLSSLSVGVLIFLLIEIAYKSLEIVEEAAKSGFTGGGLPSLSSSAPSWLSAFQ